jgi:hydrogenase maturation protease
VRPRTLVAGVGNIFLGDDGFGCEVVRRLADAGVPDGVRVVDYGIRGLHMAYDLLDGWDQLVLVDALPDRGSPGRMEIIEVGADLARAGALDAHDIAPASALSILGSLGGRLPPTVLVGVQVADISDTMGLSPQVMDALPAAVDAILALLRSSHGPVTLSATTGARGPASHEEVR